MQNFPPYIVPQQVINGEGFPVEIHHDTLLDPNIVIGQQQYPVWSQLQAPVPSIAALGNSQYPIQGMQIN